MTRLTTILLKKKKKKTRLSLSLSIDQEKTDTAQHWGGEQPGDAYTTAEKPMAHHQTGWCLRLFHRAHNKWGDCFLDFFLELLCSNRHIL